MQKCLELVFGHLLYLIKNKISIGWYFEYKLHLATLIIMFKRRCQHLLIILEHRMEICLKPESVSSFHKIIIRFYFKIFD